MNVNSTDRFAKTDKIRDLPIRILYLLNIVNFFNTKSVQVTKYYSKMIVIARDMCFV